MTAGADLVAHIDAGDAEACARALTAIDDTSRRALYAGVAQRIEQLDEQLQNVSVSSRDLTWKAYAAARVALLGVARLAELRKTRSWTFFGPYATSAIAILSERRPAWLLEWAEFELPRNVRNWSVVRALVRSGLIPRPATEFYVLGMIAEPGRRTSPRELLDRDPDLLQQELWQLFETEGSGEWSLAAYDKYVQDKHTWSAAFLGMVADGTIDRERVLRASLDALQRDFSPFRAGWFSRLHEALRPDPSERAQLCERYLDLLHSRVPATVSFATKASVEAHKAGALDAETIASRLAPAFEARDKGTVERALAIARKAIANSDAATRSRIVGLAARALGHESADVQIAAIELVGNDQKLVAPYLGTLAPSARARFGGETSAETPSGAPTVSSSAETVQPIATLTELVEIFSAVLENQGPPIDIERVIDGVARIGISATRVPEFSRHTEAIAKRAETFDSRRGVPQPRAALAAFLLAWVRGLRWGRPAAEKNLSDFLIWRLWYASEQAAQRIEQPLLSLPSAPDGRIDPTEFDRRCAALSRSQSQAASDPESLFQLDFVLARLRATGTTTEPKTALTWNKRSWTVEDRTYSYYEPSLELSDWPKASRLDPAWLSAARISGTLEMKRWCATVSPLWREGWFAAGCRELGANIDWHTADWSTRAYLEPLVNPDTSVGPMGALLIVLGLGAKEIGQGGVAVDALVAATSNGRLDAPALGEAMIAAATPGVIKFSRWAKRLHDAARAGARQSRIVFLALEALFESGAGIDSNDFGRLLELEVELAHQTGSRLTREGALQALRTGNVKGKAGSAAKALLNLR